MIGRRVYVSAALRSFALRPGEYMLTAYGWLVVLPDYQCGLLIDHQVTEHADGTITASGAIYDCGGAFTLTRGVWRDS